MFFPVRTDSPLRSTPWMNWALILLNVGLFVLQKIRPELESRYVLHPRDPQLLDYFTYSLLHGNVAHIVSNMLFLYIFGNNVNDKMGHLGYLGFYLACGVFAGVGYVWGADQPVLGASGAVAGVTGAYLVLFPRSSITVIYLFVFIGTLEIPSMWFIVFFFLKDLFYNFSGVVTGVAHSAHLSGTVFGFVVCFLLLMGNLLPRDQFDIVALVQRWNKRRQYRDMVAKGYDPFAYTPKPADLAPPDPKAQRVLDLRSEIAEAMAHGKLPDAAALYVKLRQVDANQVLARQAQLDVANQLASDQRYQQAADAYELFVRYYPNFEQMVQVELMLGLIYARYLHQYPKAKEYLLRASAKLHGRQEMELAKAELARIEPLVPIARPG
ncbi:MAG: rhomboid family intramembrane serine protease [Tepidisphaeraceae bacterium]